MAARAGLTSGGQTERHSKVETGRDKGGEEALGMRGRDRNSEQEQGGYSE